MHAARNWEAMEKQQKLFLASCRRFASLDGMEPEAIGRHISVDHVWKGIWEGVLRSIHPPEEVVPPVRIVLVSEVHQAKRTEDCGIIFQSVSLMQIIILGGSQFGGQYTWV